MTEASATPPGRIDRARLDAARFPSETVLQVRFDDLDPLWHANNAAIVTMLQEARVIFDHDFAMPKFGDGLRPVMGAMMIEFTAEITYPGTVEVATGVLRVGGTSFTVAQRIRHNGQSAVYSLITIVASGPNGATPIPAEYRAALEGKAMIS